MVAAGSGMVGERMGHDVAVMQGPSVDQWMEEFL